MSENAEYEDLDQLLHSPGWGRFVDMVDKQWGRGSDRFMNAVTDAARGDNVHLQDRLRQILAAQREIQAVMQMPENRLKLLKQPQMAIAGQSRRGGL
jgi:hypothetical protein